MRGILNRLCAAVSKLGAKPTIDGAATLLNVVNFLTGECKRVTFGFFGAADA